MIFLTGFMGSGKSAVGRKLALKNNMPFVDLDRLISEKTGAKIPDIFNYAGEKAFRRLEREVLLESVDDGRNKIVATGGGLPVDPVNRQIMKAAGTIIFLDASIETIRGRIGSATDRPLWGPEADALYETRRSAYEDADRVIKTDGKDLMTVAAEVEQVFENLSAPVPVVTESAAYPVYIGAGIFERFRHYLKRHAEPEGVFVLVDEKVYGLHLPRIEGALSDMRHQVMPVPSGEASKSFGQLEKVMDSMLSCQVNRNWVMLAVGGGVTGDLAGFAASMFMRGIPVIQVPTTLLSQVDSSIGGKTGINHARGKNLIGSFHQPLFVVSDVSFLETLPETEKRAAMAEVVKYGVIMDEDLFSYLELGSYDTYDLEKIVRMCAADKARVVALDEREGGIRRTLNFGHTIGHAIEKFNDFRISHGSAVAAGMIFAAWLSEDMNLIDNMEFQQIRKLIRDLDMVPADLKMPAADDVAGAITLDKKGFEKGLHFVLTEGVGSVSVKMLSNSKILDAYEGFLHGYGQGL